MPSRLAPAVATFEITFEKSAEWPRRSVAQQDGHGMHLAIEMKGLQRGSARQASLVSQTRSLHGYLCDPTIYTDVVKPAIIVSR